MANVKISELTATNVVADADLMEISSASGGAFVSRKSLLLTVATYIIGKVNAALDATPLTVARGGTGGATQAAGRTGLGLGTIATQDASGVAITGGSVTGITDLAVADGGTGASTIAAARSNLGAAASGANTDIISITGSAAKLTTARNINGVAFDGTASITVPAVDTATPRAALAGADFTGSVGIGAAANTYRLRVVSNTGAGLQISVSNSSTGNPAFDMTDGPVELIITPSSGSNAVFFGSYSNHPANIVVGATTRWSFTATGPIVSTGLPNAASDSAATTAGVPINGLYRNGSVVMIRVV